MPTPRIHKLSPLLVNQIAAGEVIERPSSIIKELLENSLDAGATAIEIDVEMGGTQLIRVRDNGYGIHPDDMRLALESHATSKLKSVTDLDHIASLGFRGEALPSIAAIAALTLISRLEGEQQAWKVSVDPVTGTAERQPAAHPTGTTVEVRELFHTTPARKRFLRSQRTEFLHILEMVRRLALSRFGVALRLRHNGKIVLNCKGEGYRRELRVAEIMGRNFANKAIQLEYGGDDMTLWGWLGTADLSRSQSDRQYFYLNGRMLRDKRVNHAIRLAYGERIAAGRYPAYLLYLNVDPSTVDVNVHPCKYEVRFKAARNVHDFIHASLHSALEERGLFAIEEPGSSQRAAQGERGLMGRPMEQAVANYTALMEKGQPATPAAAGASGLGRPISQIHGRFIITVRGQDFLLIDTYAAHHYVARMRMQAATDEKPVRHRPLLVPVSLTVSAEIADAIEQHCELLQRYGLTLVRSAPTSVSVRTLPTFLQDADIHALVMEIGEFLGHGITVEGPLTNGIISAISNQAWNGINGRASSEDLMQLLHSLEELGVDIQVKSCPPLWRSLDVSLLEAFLT